MIYYTAAGLFVHSTIIIVNATIYKWQCTCYIQVVLFIANCACCLNLDGNQQVDNFDESKILAKYEQRLRRLVRHKKENSLFLTLLLWKTNWTPKQIHQTVLFEHPPSIDLIHSPNSLLPIAIVSLLGSGTSQVIHREYNVRLIAW